MKKMMRKSLLTAVLALGMTGMAFGFGVGPGLDYGGYDWLVTTYNGGYAVVPKDVTSTVNHTDNTVTYHVQVKEVYNPWTVRDTLIPDLQAQGYQVGDYSKYWYSMADYEVRVVYSWLPSDTVAPTGKTFYVAKTSEQDFDLQGNALGPKRTYNAQPAQVQSGTDGYAIATALEKGYFNDDIVLKQPLKK